MMFLPAKRPEEIRNEQRRGPDAARRDPGFTSFNPSYDSIDGEAA
jgi:hypothetical protein